MCGMMTWSWVQPNFTLRCGPQGKLNDKGLPDCLTPILWTTFIRRLNSPEITSPNIYDAGYTDTLNLYDVSGLAHFELYRALEMAGNPSGLAVSKSSIRKQFLRQVDDAITQAATDPWGFGYQWSYGDTTSHGAGLSVMASEADYMTQSKTYDTIRRDGWPTFSERMPGARPSLWATEALFRIVSSTR
jgi:hypothetical protein